jgi:hypothetical protein
MPSTYSTSLKLQLIGTGEQAGTWGTTTNYNLGTLLEQAITGVVTIPMGDATYTLTNYNGLSDEARNAVLILQGPITAPQYLAIPAGQQKVYIVRNRTGNTVTLTTGTGSNISVANAASEVLFTDGANVYSATQFNYINGDLTVSGTAYANNVVATNDITLGRDLFANASTGQIYLPTGDQNTRTSSPIVGLIRYNTTGQFYEGYTNAAWVRFTVAPQGNYTVSYLMISGGAGGATNGGGGAGGYVANTLVGVPGTVYTITVGAGGAPNTNGGISSIAGVATGIGGGTGGTIATPRGTAGSAGGSGGGGGGGFNEADPGGAGGSGSQGNNGGSGGTQGGGYGGGGGGGGATAAGTGASFSNGGAGGAGTVNTITGTAITYAGGGGGGSGNGYLSVGAAGGAGGGGTGGGFEGDAPHPGGNGTAYTGGGGGGGSSGASGGNGGSGVIIISMPTVSYSGVTTGIPTVTTYGSTTVLKYINSGTYTA